jgi:hypothetical protein
MGIGATGVSTERRDVHREAHTHKESREGLREVLAIGGQQSQPITDRRCPPAQESQGKRMDSAEINDPNLAGEVGKATISEKVKARQDASSDVLHALGRRQVPRRQFRSQPNRAEEDVGNLLPPCNHVARLRHHDDIELLPTEGGLGQGYFGEIFGR